MSTQLARIGGALVLLVAGRVAAYSPTPVPLRPLQRQEIVDKLDAVPVFSVVNQQTQQLVPELTVHGAVRCTFHLDVAEATERLKLLQAANPGVPLTLSATPLGTAFALCEWEEHSQGTESRADELDEDGEAEEQAAAGTATGEQIELRLQAARAEAEAAEPLLAEAPVPPMLRRRNTVNGALPLFGSDDIRFASDEGADADKTCLPLFFSRGDLRDAWLASGGSEEQMPVMQVTDLRTLAWQMQFDTSRDWRPLLFVAPSSSIDYVVAEGGGEPAAAPEVEIELSRADVAGLVFPPVDSA